METKKTEEQQHNNPGAVRETPALDATPVVRIRDGSQQDCRQYGEHSAQCKNDNRVEYSARREWLRMFHVNNSGC